MLVLLESGEVFNMLVLPRGLSRLILDSFGKHYLRAFSSTLIKNLAFIISKPNFITYKTPLYNILYIKTSIFLTLHLKILSLSLYIIFNSSSLCLCLSLLCVSLSQPSAAGHHIHPPISQAPHPPTNITTTTSKNHPNHRITKS